MKSKWNDKEVTRKIKRHLQNKLTAVGIFGVGIAKVYCPVDTGNLRGSIDYKVDDNSVRIGTPVEYAPYIEFGTGEFAEGGKGRKGGWFVSTPEGKKFFTFGNKPQPFLRPIITAHKEQIFSIMAK